MSRRGTNYNERLAQAYRAEARGRLLARVAANLASDGARTATREGAHAECGHLWSEHDDQDGCLHGWGEPPRVGCQCEAT